MNFITASLVIYNTPSSVLINLINSFAQSTIKVKLFVVDNSDFELNFDFSNYDFIEYHKMRKNIGFSAGHNYAIKKSFGLSDYHLIVNPDIEFNKYVLEILYNRISRDDSIGIIAPKILYPNGLFQSSYKLLPTPLNLLIRLTKLHVYSNICKAVNFKYELKLHDHTKEINAPFLSGCFLFVRTSVFSEIGLLDQNYFLYLEDVDFSRRVHYKYKTLYYPFTFAYHTHQKSSFSNLKHLILHLQSSIKYFNKWGWIYDPDRIYINNACLKHII